MSAFIKFIISAFILIASTSISHADISLHDDRGQSIPFSSLKGKWILINYWAGWCETCIEEIPELNRFYKSHKNDPVVLFGMNSDGLSAFEQKKLIKQFNIHYPNLLKNPAKELQLSDIDGVPVTFIFNPKGRLVKTLYGGQTVKTLNKAISGR